jgi:hypothetical protein
VRAPLVSNTIVATFDTAIFILLLETSIIL